MLITNRIIPGKVLDMIKLEDIIHEQCELTTYNISNITTEGSIPDRINYIMSKFMKTIVKITAWVIDKFRNMIRFISDRVLKVLEKVENKPQLKVLGWVDCKLTGIIDLLYYANIVKKIYDSIVGLHPIDKSSPFYKDIEKLQNVPGGISTYIRNITLSEPKDVMYTSIVPTLKASNKLAQAAESKLSDILSKLKYIKGADKIRRFVDKFGIGRIVDRLFYMANTIIAGVTSASNAISYYIHQCSRVSSMVANGNSVIDLK